MVCGGRARPKREPTEAPRAKNCSSARIEMPSHGTNATSISTAMPMPSAAGGTNRCPGPAGSDSPMRNAKELRPITMLRKMITGSSGISGIPTMEMASSTISGSRSSQQRNPTVKLRTGFSNMANPTLRTRSGHIRRTSRPTR